ncbi:alpha/beta hydrolase [Flavobacterium sp. SM15]|uniref:alpha/beta hydrolase family protein n=1 Tax=Flavobacterium sp. SM15 TaxID=2908005 RepID=UPI001EDC0899|nr:alpha/beta hydrolase [Flavobacterium sp. SM15]MCG2611219.1 alpha/beta hydrolase [Flavobacterium sp. SM15]
MKHTFSLLLLFLSTFLVAQTEKFSKEELVINPLIKGDLYTSKINNTKQTLVILIAGSGPTNRNGNQIGMQNNSLKYLAEDLSSNGYSVFSYDKRVIAQIIAGNINESEGRFEDLIEDAVSVYDYFKKNNLFTKIVFAGHSEGSLVGMIASEKTKAAAYISIAGTGRTIDQVLVEQIAKQMPSYKEKTAEYLATLKKGQTIKDAPPALQSLFRESVQPYIISWMKYNPQDEIQKLKCPVLLLNGDKDLQVEPKEAHLLHSVKKEAEILIIENMNHVFKNIATDEKENMESYSNPNLRNHPKLSEVIVAFLNKKV